MSKPYLDLDQIFTYHPPFGDQADRYAKLRAAAKAYAELVVELTPASAEQTLAIRDIQRAAMMANAAIAINESRDKLPSLGRDLGIVGRVQTGENSFVEMTSTPSETIEAIFLKNGEKIFLVPSPAKDALSKIGALIGNSFSIAQYNPVWTQYDGVLRSQRYRVTIMDSFKPLSECTVLNAEATDEPVNQEKSSFEKKLIRFARVLDYEGKFHYFAQFAPEKDVTNCALYYVDSFVDGFNSKSIKFSGKLSESRYSCEFQQVGFRSCQLRAVFEEWESDRYE